MIATGYGASSLSDVFFVAFRIPDFLRRMVHEGSLNTAFIPVIAEGFHHSPQSGKKTIQALMTFTLLLTGILSIVGVVFSKEIVFFLSPGFGSDTKQSALAASLLQIMFPYVVCVGVLALSSSLLNYLGHFALPALSPVILNLSIIGAAIVSHYVFSNTIYALGWGVVIGGLLSFLPQLFYLKKFGFTFSFQAFWRENSVKKLSCVALPALFSASLYQLMIFINTLFASLFQEGSISTLYYADRLFQFPLGVFAVAVVSVLLPKFSKLAVANDDQALLQNLSLGLEWLSFITIPASVGLWMLSSPIVRLLFEHGNFTTSDTIETAHLLSLFALGLWAVSAQGLLLRAYLSKKNSFIPVGVTSLSLLLHLFLSLLLLGTSQLDSPEKNAFTEQISRLLENLSLFSFGVSGLALATSITSFFSLFLFILLLPTIQLSLERKRVGRGIIKALSSSVMMIVYLLLLRTMIRSETVLLLLGIVGGATIYFVVALLLRFEPAVLIFCYFRDVLNRRLPAA